MKIPATTITVPPRLRRKRRAQPTIANPAVTVVAVVWIDEQHALWEFSSQVVSFGVVSGLLIMGQEPDVVENTEEGNLFIAYTSGVSVDDVWEANGIVAIVFANGGTIQIPESGTVTS